MEYTVKMNLIHGSTGQEGGWKPTLNVVWSCAICKTGQLHDGQIQEGTKVRCSVCDQHFTVLHWSNRTESGNVRDVVVEAERPTKLELLRD